MYFDAFLCYRWKSTYLRLLVTGTKLNFLVIKLCITHFRWFSPSTQMYEKGNNMCVIQNISKSLSTLCLKIATHDLPSHCCVMMSTVINEKGWPKRSVSFFCKIKDTVFVFTNNFIDLDILSTLALVWYNIDCSQLMSWFDHCQLQLVYRTVEHHPVRNLQHEISQNTFTHSISHSTFSTHCTSFLSYQLHFYLSWNNKA